MNDKIEPTKYITKCVKVPAYELVALINSSIRLDFLDAGGVDNWEGYGESLEDIENKYVSVGYVLSKYEEVRDE